MEITIFCRPQSYPSPAFETWAQPYADNPCFGNCEWIFHPYHIFIAESQYPSIISDHSGFWTHQEFYPIDDLQKTPSQIPSHRNALQECKQGGRQFYSAEWL